MIASLIVTLDSTSEDTIDEIARLPGVEVGVMDVLTHRVPITIDSPAPHALEETTRKLLECAGVIFVDVVFVHLEQVKT